MNYLTDEEIKDLDIQIDEFIKSFKLLLRPRDEAVLYLLSHFDLWIEAIGKNYDVNRRNGYKVSYDALNHSIRWVFEHCPESKNDDAIDLGVDGFEEAAEIFSHAMNYSELWAQMSLLYKGRNLVSKQSKNIFRISSTSLEKKEVDVARMMLAHADDPLKIEDTYITNNHTETYVQNKLVIRKTFNRTFDYSFPGEVFSLVKDLVEKRNLRKWTMDPNWDLGGYTYKQLKGFWNTLHVLSIIHAFAARTIKKTHKRENSLIKIQRFEHWIEDINKWAKLPREIVSQIISDTIYDSSLHQSGGKKAHVMYQPFFRLKDGRLALSGTIVQISEIERNVWDLISQIRPKVHGKLRNLKEGFWIYEIKEKMSELNIDCIPDIKFKFKGQEGQVDLLMIDKGLKFGLICELKWLTPAANVAGVAYNDEQLGKGINQARLADQWINSETAELSRKTKIAIGELSEIEWKPLVIGKNSLPSGFLKSDDVPIINELLFTWILESPHQKDLRTLWLVADSRSYLPVEGKHFRNSSIPVEWGNLKFTLDNGFNILTTWRPEKDISFPCPSN